MVSDDCYFLQHFQQYRPCSAICNNVVCDSIDEDRCRAYCPGNSPHSIITLGVNITDVSKSQLCTVSKIGEKVLQ